MTQQTSQKVGFFGAISEFRKWAVLILVALVLFFGYKFFTTKNQTSSIEYDTNLIEQQIKNVGKLVVTEGHFAEVMTYKDQQKYMMNLFSFEKKALVVINAEVTVSFDLSKMEYDIDAKRKIVTIKNIPNEEVKIYPDYKYYDVTQSKLNEFTAEDYNKINKTARANLSKKIEKSTLKTNAKNRLISELFNILILTKSMGWKLQYNGSDITTPQEFNLKT